MRVPDFREPGQERRLETAIAASIEILSKQESLRIPCVRYDAGGFPERSTGPMVGSKKQQHGGRECHGRQTCPRLLFSRTTGKRSHLRELVTRLLPALETAIKIQTAFFQDYIRLAWLSPSRDRGDLINRNICTQLKSGLRKHELAGAVADWVN